eukprot:TRINITY_DN599_c0_g2_i2.p2 TRINITY_DN599_c0_g2~~TRINITY_DN599_c0_g2_i2.p2  ORF type:complete len:144 (-),score=39.42 TRINITY_DN599_c0_g2_i2:222-653(-)
MYSALIPQSTWGGSLPVLHTNTTQVVMKFAVVALLALVAAASAFVAPSAPLAQRSCSRLFAEGKYDGKLWDEAAKQDVLSTYDASKPWGETNFDPYKRDGNGNACDPSGYYPGEGKYKDPIRPSVSFAEYQKQREEAAKAAGN